MDARTYRTRNIEQAATIQAKTKIDPTIIFDDAGLATFIFPETPDVVAVVMTYDAELLIDARTVLTTRNNLFRLIKRRRYE